MILVTVGTNEQPFDRLVQAAAELQGEEHLVVQYGSSAVAHGRGEWIDFIPYEALTERMLAARVVICHAGVGSIVLARRCGTTPIVVPRRLHLKEAVDDHQLPLARRLDAAGMVTLVEDVRELSRAIERDLRDSLTLTTRTESLPGADALAGEVRSYLEELRAA